MRRERAHCPNYGHTECDKRPLFLDNDKRSCLGDDDRLYKRDILSSGDMPTKAGTVQRARKHITTQRGWIPTLSIPYHTDRCVPGGPTRVNDMDAKQ